METIRRIVDTVDPCPSLVLKRYGQSHRPPPLRNTRKRCDELSGGVGDHGVDRRRLSSHLVNTDRATGIHDALEVPAGLLNRSYRLRPADQPSDVFSLVEDALARRTCISGSVPLQDMRKTAL